MRQPGAFRLCTAFCLVLLTFDAGAGNWRLSGDGPLTTRLTWVDGGNSEGTFLSLRPSFRLTGSGGRVNAEVAYQPSFDQQLGDGWDSNLSHSLRANGDARLYEQMLFVRATAYAGLASSDGRGLVGSDGINAIGDDDIVQTYGVSVSPELRNRLGSFANSRLTTSFDVVDSETDDFLSSGSDLVWQLTSGSRFPVVPWSLTVQTNRISYDDRDDRRDSITGQVSRRFDRYWLGRVSFGYENNDVETSRDDTDGLTWSVGGAWTPNPRTSLDATYGKRYFGDTWTVAGSHVSKRTRLAAAFTREISNLRTQILEQGGQEFLVDPVTGELVRDPFTGAPILVDQGLVPRLVNEDFLNNAVRLSAGLVGRRTAGTLTLGWSRRDYEVSDIDEEDYSAQLRLSRQMRADVSGTLGFGWQQVDSTGAADSETYFVQLGANQRYGRRTTLGLEGSYRTEEVTGADRTDEARVSLIVSIELF